MKETWRWTVCVHMWLLTHVSACFCSGMFPGTSTLLVARMIPFIADEK